MSDIAPVTPDRWDDLVKLFGERGASSGCWCMWWRVTQADFTAQAGAGLRRWFEDLVKEGHKPGLLAYRDGRPVGWVGLGRREEFGRLQRSVKLGPVDDAPVWSINCFYIDRRHRGAGVAGDLLDGAVAHARGRGATMVEGYPIDVARATRTSVDLYTGTLEMFERAGFREVARRGGRPIVRRRLTRRSKRAAFAQS